MTTDLPQPRMQWPVTFSDGAHALASGYDGTILELICDRAHPPGRPLELSLQSGSATVTLRGKSAGSKRREDQRYDVRLRLHSLRREERAQLEQLFPKT